MIRWFAILFVLGTQGSSQILWAESYPINNVKMVVSLLRNPVVSLERKPVVNLSRNQVVNLSEISNTGSLQYTQYYSHNLAPDGKIYIPISNNYGLNSQTALTSHLDVIEYPDSVGLACHYVRQGFDLGNHYVQGYLPNMPYYGLGADTSSICDSLTVVQSLEVQSSKLEVYPNPSEGIFSLKLKDVNDKIISVNIEDILGKEVFVIKIFSSMIDISSQPPGIYFVHAITKKKKLFVTKVVKE